MEHFEYCTCTHVESYSINPLIPTIKIHTQMDTHRQLWCSWECNDQRQRPIHIAPVPRCRIIIEYDNTQLSLRIIQNATTRPHDTPTHARFNRKSQAAGYIFTTRLCANGHKFLQTSQRLKFYKLFCHWFVIA